MSIIKSTPARGLKEYQALIHCFGKNPEPKVNSIKYMIGDLLGAAGGVEVVAPNQLKDMVLKFSSTSKQSSRSEPGSSSRGMGPIENPENTVAEGVQYPNMGGCLGTQNLN